MGTLGDGGGDGGAGGADAKKDDIYENRPRHKKIIRVVTVMAYMVSVSFVAIVLSAYYVFLWQPPNPRLMHRSHLRADPQVEYLVHEVPEDVPEDGIDDPKRVIVLGEKISVGSPERSRSLKVSGVDPRTKESSKIGDDRRTSARAWNPIVRALLATTENPGVEALADSTGVYESVDATVKSSLKTESSNSEIHGSRTSGSDSDSMTMFRSGDELYGLGNYSGLVAERGHKLYEESVNYSTPIDLDNLSGETGDDFGRGFGESMGRREEESRENSGNFTPEVQPIPTGTEETSGKSGPVEAQAETLGTTANFGRDFGESMRMRAEESRENSGNFTPDVQPVPTGTEETSGKSRPAEAQAETLGTTANFGADFGESMRMRAKESRENSGNFTPEVQPVPAGTEETSGKSRPAEAQPETLGTTANFGSTFGESMRRRPKELLENSGNFTPEVQNIPITTVGTSGKSRPAEAQAEMLGTTANFGSTFGESMRRRPKELLDNSRNFTPEVQNIPITTVGTSGKSGPAEAQPETLGTIANFGPHFGESMKKSSTNFPPEVQPISIGVEERSVPTVGTSGKSRPAQAQPETLGTTANFGPNFGEPMRKSSTNFPPEVQPIRIGLEERSVWTVATSGKSRAAQAQPETLGTTANFGPNFGESMRMSSTNFPPEVQPISIGLEERSVSTVGTSGKSGPAQAQPETLGKTANLGPVFGEPMRKSSRNFPSEVQPIPIGLEEKSVSTVGTSGKSGPPQAQPETLGTTAASDQQRGLDWKPLGFTVRPAKLGSSITRVEAKLPINDTEPVGKFSSALEANEEVPIEMIAGPTGDAELASEQSASAVPAVVQPEPDYVDK